MRRPEREPAEGLGECVTCGRPVTSADGRAVFYPPRVVFHAGDCEAVFLALHDAALLELNMAFAARRGAAVPKERRRGKGVAA